MAKPAEAIVVYTRDGSAYMSPESMAKQLCDWLRTNDQRTMTVELPDGTTFIGVRYPPRKKA